jgi:hypothetical protein
MSRILKNFNSLEIVKINFLDDILKKNEKGGSSQFESLSKKYFNGKILCCFNYSLKNNKVMAYCYSHNFFDFMLNNIKRDFLIGGVNVNAIVEVDSDYILIFKRDNRVSSFKGYWDFPAGIVPFGQNLEERMINRIYEDTKIKEEFIELEKCPSFIEIKNNSFGVYYKAKSKLKYSEVEEILNKNFKENKPILLKKSEIPKFISDTKKVYPVNILKQIC